MPDQPSLVNDFIFDADGGNFTERVLANSRRNPVLVHFWSRNTGQTTALYPRLKKLVASYAGVLLLINIDIDEQPDLAAAYAIASAPTLKLFIDEQAVETLSGFHREADLRFMLDQHVASDHDPIIRDALQMYARGQQEAAYQKLGQAALDDPGCYRLPLTIARLLGNEGRHEQALRLLHAMPATIRRKAICSRLQVELEFGWIAQPVKSADELEKFVAQNLNQSPAVAMLASWYVTQENYAAALGLFKEILQRDPAFENGLGRRSIINILSLLEDDDALINEYRTLLRKHAH